MANTEIEKSKVHLTAALVDYLPHSIVIRTVLKKLTGNVSIMSFDKGQGMAEKISPFDTYIQCLDGSVELVIAKAAKHLDEAESIVVPAHASYQIKPNGQFKIASTVIKSGYE